MFQSFLVKADLLSNILQLRDFMYTVSGKTKREGGFMFATAWTQREESYIKHK